MALNKSNFFKIFRVNRVSREKVYIGTAFPVQPGGGLLTCRHVVDQTLADEEYLAVVDGAAQSVFEVQEIRFPSDPRLDIGYLVGEPGNGRTSFFPLLEPSAVVQGESVFTFGFFLPSGSRDKTEDAYFGGNIVNFVQPPDAPFPEMTLSYAAVEGLSGAPVLTYHHGTKVVGMVHGSKSSRILAAEVLSYEDSERQYRETIHRIVEFGVAYHVATIASVLDELGIDQAVVTTESVDGLGLE